jgi:hypothetical protein
LDAACTAGKSGPINTAMMAITTSNSMSVNPYRCCFMRPSNPVHTLKRMNEEILIKIAIKRAKYNQNQVVRRNQRPA